MQERIISIKPEFVQHNCARLTDRKLGRYEFYVHTQLCTSPCSHMTGVRISQVFYSYVRKRKS